MPVLQDWVNFHFPCKLHIEVDCASKAGNFIKHVGSRFLLITTQRELQNPNELYALKSSIERETEGLIIYDDIENVGTFKELDTAAHFARQSQVNCIIAYGSFESVNIAKVVSILASNDLFAEELILQTKKATRKPLPLVIIPTMPLMGIECAPFCTILDERENERKYFASSDLFPELIVADAKIGLHMTSSDIAKTGTSILAAAIDTILSKYANEITNSSSLRAIELVSKNIITSIRDPKNIPAKNALYAASLLTGISQSVSSLGLCFAISLATMSLTKLDIFQAMSILLPHIMEYNLTTSANKYVMIARALDEDTSDISVIEAAIKAVEGIRKIYIELKIPQRLSEYEVKKNELPKIASLAFSMSFLDCLPRELPKNEIETILVAAY
ncbi:MAG: iron-containing alcohol dehydrogenase [Leptospiraceae bacterium]|jgi:alcohol dehydrogenase|nr:iron-containing alcohol dehydrogenase [Leptospiraceae bacterium]